MKSRSGIANKINAFMLTFILAVALLGFPAHAQNHDVLSVQRGLALAGYEPGPLDGYWGGLTESALSELMEDYGIAAEVGGPDDLSGTVFDALVRAFNALHEALEADKPHLQVALGVVDARHLLERTGIGAHPAEIDRLVGLTRSEAISQIIAGLDARAPLLPQPTWVESGPFPDYWLRWDYEEEERSRFRMARDREMNQLRAWWVDELIATDRPQAERLILYWHNHFVTAYSAIQEESHAIYLQHQLFRSRGHQNFRDLVTAILYDPAMLNYLDNDRSREEQPNENLARELMELFVLGEGNYDEETVKEVARALTGYGYTRMGRMEFQFSPWDHDSGRKTIFGRTGRWRAEDVADILLDQPEAAEFVARKFWTAYVSEFNYDEEELATVAAAFRDADYDVKTLLRYLLASRAFWAEENRGTIVKSPVDLLIGSARSQGLHLGEVVSLPNQLAALGQNLFEPPNVAGWPGAGDWLTPSRILLRNDTLDRLADYVDDAADQEQPDASVAMAGADTGSAEMAGVDEPSMSEGGDTAGGTIRVRYAAENFEGPPIFRVYVMRENEEGALRTDWVSPVVVAEGGIDTERYGRVMASDLPWRETEIPVPREIDPAAFRVSFVNDHCCGAGGSDGGDRNFYVDWVSFDGRLYPVSAGEQRTSCTSPNADREPGRLFCNGHVTLSEYVTEDTEPVFARSSDRLLIDRVAFEWAEEMRAGDNWVSFSLGVLSPRLGSVGAQAMKVELVRNNTDDAGQRLLLKISERECYPNCLGAPMPSAAYTNRETGHREMNFVLIGREWDDERRQWNALTDEQRAFVSSLWVAVPDFIRQAMRGRNWREREAQRKYETWSEWLALVEEALPRSRYARHAAPGGWGMSGIQPDANSMSMMMSMMSGTGAGEPMVVAGMPSDDARDYVDGLAQSAPPAQYFLTSIAGVDLPQVGQLSEIFQHPMYQLK
ncbi:MAG: DUF1800 family protein [Altererythrobacter sp.]|nr:DUF1800 family protein [Altererythrobacter sp.]